MQATRRLWRWLGLVCLLSFGALGYLGWEIYLQAPPIPKAVLTSDGRTLYTHDDIIHGQQAWLAAGGQQLGTVWGHGSYVAPDWSADWLHREALELRAIRAQQRYHRPYDQLAPADRGAIDAALKDEMRRNTYDAAADTVTVSPERAEAIRRVAAHIEGVAEAFTSGSRSGVLGSGSSACTVWYQTMPAMPAMSRMMLTAVQAVAVPVRLLPTMGSCGQLLV